jgi:hypothetical protein
MSQTTLKGSCLCGAVKYEVTGDPKRFYHCHCSRCRKATGTGHASNLFLQPAALRWLSGEQQIRAFKVPEAKRFTNCLLRYVRRPLAASAEGLRHCRDSGRIVGRRGSDQTAGAHLLQLAHELVVCRWRVAGLPGIRIPVAVGLRGLLLPARTGH